jgi:hypothetical protein
MAFIFALRSGTWPGRDKVAREVSRIPIKDAGAKDAGSDAGAPSGPWGLT